MLNLWAITSIVRSFIRLSTAFCMKASLFTSSAEVASSRTSSGGFFKNTRASAMRLPAREPVASLSDDCLISVFEFEDKFVGVRHFCGFFDFFARGRRAGD